jgi:hypothetical protein
MVGCVPAIGLLPSKAFSTQAVPARSFVLLLAQALTMITKMGSAMAILAVFKSTFISTLQITW